VEVWQTPLFEPGGMAHCRPLQQSPLLVHTPPVPMHWVGSWHVPFVQMDEQHSDELVQAVPRLLHEVTVRQVAPVISSARHCPEQQSLPPSAPGVQAEPSGVQVPAVQRRTPT
jgi:hypothetical protein